jgi:hypothetical protein
MRVLLPKYGSRGDVTVAAAAGERDAPVATGATPTGGWR